MDKSSLYQRIKDIDEHLELALSLENIVSDSDASQIVQDAMKKLQSIHQTYKSFILKYDEMEALEKKAKECEMEQETIYKELEPEKAEKLKQEIEYDQRHPLKRNAKLFAKMLLYKLLSFVYLPVSKRKRDHYNTCSKSYSHTLEVYLSVQKMEKENRSKREEILREKHIIDQSEARVVEEYRKQGMDEKTALWLVDGPERFYFLRLEHVRKEHANWL